MGDTSYTRLGKTAVNSRTELVALANLQKEEGKRDLAEFIINRGAKTVAEALSTVWEMAEANTKLKIRKMSRIQILQQVKEGTCPDDCNGAWFDCAQEVLEWNGIPRPTFAEVVTDLLEKGRGKFLNLLLVGRLILRRPFF